MVFSTLYNRILMFSKGYRHSQSVLDLFYQNVDKYKVASVNNQALDLQTLGNSFYISRFIRDPRDLVVSGYFYHRRGVEKWSNFVDPDALSWRYVNGHVPEQMPGGQSFAGYLQGLNEEDGLIAEIDFRKNHFESMMQWPVDDPRIKLFRYEDIIGNELEVFGAIFSHYGLSWPERKLGLLLAHHLSAKKRMHKTKHIRNPTTGQWKNHFTPKVERYFENKYGGILERYGYN
jgi:hypothetical protein